MSDTDHNHEAAKTRSHEGRLLLAAKLQFGHPFAAAAWKSGGVHRGTTMMRNYVRGCCTLWTACMMLSCLGGVLFTRPAGAQHAAAVQVAPPPVGGKLARAVLLGGDPLTAQDLPPDLPSSDRLRLLAYLERRADFRSRLGTSSSGGPVAAHQGRLERDIATVVERAGIEHEAAEIARSAPPSAEGPARAAHEASWAEGVLRQRPSSPAAPYLYAYLAARYRQVFEQLPDDRPALERQARKYKTMLERVRGADDPIFQLLANDLDGLPSLSAGATRRPQQYLPDT